MVCGNEIGRYAFLGAGTVVASAIPDYALVVGVPGRRVGWVCRCGVRLSDSAGETPGDELVCGSCGNRYCERDERLTYIHEVQSDD
ncbi:MAG: hypothetical protein GY733_11490 [bacterium]|nr:hypothetical protein [bacterium]